MKNCRTICNGHYMYYSPHSFPSSPPSSMCLFFFPCYFLPSWDFYFNILLHLLNSLYYSSPLCIFIRIYIFSKQTKLEVEAEFDFDSLSVLGRKIIKNYLWYLATAIACWKGIMFVFINIFLFTPGTTLTWYDCWVDFLIKW